MKDLKKKFGRALFALAACLLLGTGAWESSAADRPEKLVPLGCTAGIKLYAPGAVVRSLERLDTPEGPGCPAELAGLLPGDVITSVNGEAVTENSQLTALIRNSRGSLKLGVLRSGEELTFELRPAVCRDGVRRIGAAVRDSLAGIGTLTYFDPATGTFGALGHGICDEDTGLLFPAERGSLVPSHVTGVRRGTAGEPGGLLGSFDSQNDCGSIAKNTELGIFGELDPGELCPRLLSAEPIPVGYGEIRPGRAVIVSNISGDEVREYSVEILGAVDHDRPTKNIRIRITDPVLLEATGGIVQGMSGSPIIQNGKLVGAVTHVCVNDPTEGFGITVDRMLGEAMLSGGTAAFDRAA